MIKAFAFQDLTQRMDYSPCSTLPSLGARNAGFTQKEEVHFLFANYLA